MGVEVLKARTWLGRGKCFALLNLLWRRGRSLTPFVWWVVPSAAECCEASPVWILTGPAVVSGDSGCGTAEVVAYDCINAAQTIAIKNEARVFISIAPPLLWRFHSCDPGTPPSGEAPLRAA